MFERLRGNENIGPQVVPPTKIETEAESIHRAIFTRSLELRKTCPNAVFRTDLQDQEPRAVLWVDADGRVVRQEFFESTFSADEPRFLEEYYRAASDCGHIAVHYSDLSFPEDYILRKVGQIFERVRQGGADQDVHIHGYLFDQEGSSRLII